MPDYFPHSPAASRASSPCSHCSEECFKCHNQGWVRLSGHTGSCISKFVHEGAANLIAHLEAEMQSVQSIFTKRDTLLSSWERDIAGIQDAAASLMQGIEKDCRRLGQSICNVERAHSHAKRMEKFMDSFASEVNTMTSKMQQQEQTLNRLAEELSKKQSELQISELENYNMGLRINKLEEASSEDARVNSELQTRASMLTGELWKVHGQHASLLKLELENSDLQERLAGLLKQNSDLEQFKTQAKHQEGQVKTLTAQLQDARRELQNKDRVTKELEEELLLEQVMVRSHQTRAQDLELSLKKHEKTRAEYENAKRMYDRLDNDKINMNSQISELQARVTQQTRDLQRARGESWKAWEQVLENAEFKRESEELTCELQEARCELQKTKDLLNQLQGDFLKEPPHMRYNQTSTQELQGHQVVLPGSMLSQSELRELTVGSKRQIPVWALRWNQKYVHSRFIFTGKHEHNKQSIFKLVDDFMRDRQTPSSLTHHKPLHVFVKRMPDGLLGLYSGDNRRLVALMLYQAMCRDDAIRVWCKICAESKRDNSPTVGLAIRPQPHQDIVCFHNDQELFDEDFWSSGDDL